MTKIAIVKTDFSKNLYLENLLSADPHYANQYGMMFSIKIPGIAE